MKRRKQASILATMVVTGLLGIGVFGSGSASADVLCSSVSNWPDCPTANTYGVGKEFEAYPEGAAVVRNGAGVVMASCWGNSVLFSMKVTKAGGNYYYNYPEVDTTKLGFGSNCGNDSISVVNDGTAAIKLASQMKGSFIPAGLQIKLRTNWLYDEWGYGANEYYECTYQINGAGAIAGPKTYGGTTTVLEFNEAAGSKVSGEGLGCSTNVKLTAKYTFDPASGHIYLMES